MAFAIGLVLAIVAGLVAPGSATVILALVMVGIIVGILNITARDFAPLSMAAIALIVVGTAGFDPLDQLVSGLGIHVNEIVQYLARLMAPAAVIGAVRTLINVGFPKY
ncbi:MAG: hypothetical protein PHU08_05900 [Dehalococcoidales bacterium]|nr:hypothetical protein [Dehalococcoidales bacterium]